MKRRKTNSERRLGKQVDDLQTMTDFLKAELKSREINGEENVKSLRDAIKIVLDNRDVIAALQRDLVATKARLSSVEQIIVGFLDKDQREIADLCGITSVDYAIQYTRFLHSNRDLIEQVQNSRSH